MIKNTDIAINDFRQVIWSDSDIAKYYYNRGSVYYKYKDYDKAITDYKLAIEHDSQNNEYYAALIVSEFDKCNANLDRAIEETKKQLYHTSLSTTDRPDSLYLTYRRLKW